MCQICLNNVPKRCKDNTFYLNSSYKGQITVCFVPVAVSTEHCYQYEYQLRVEEAYWKTRTEEGALRDYGARGKKGKFEM